MINEEYGVCLSHELHAFLLDGLYKDMNRVKNKPFIKSKDADGRHDEEVADEYWANHIARNDLIIVDVCLGQYKSTLVSPACEKISVTSDPFMHLSLPLQSTTTRKMSVTVFSCDRSVVRVTCTIIVLKQGRVRDFIQAVSSSCALKQNEKVFIVEVNLKKTKGETSTPTREQNITLQCPKLNESNYTTWAIMMETILKAYGLWETLEATEKVDERKIHTTKAMILTTKALIPLLLLSFDNQTSQVVIIHQSV
ncbi:ubiquitin carboxyl-terminal hydrolase 5 [Tanacetum coccineum]